jgi:hypothetical protein
MKTLLQPKFILLFVFLVAAFFLLRREFEGEKDVLIAGDQSGKVCPVHNILLKLDTVEIHIRKEEPDSTYFAAEKKYFPMAQDTFYLLQWFQDDEHKNLTRAQIWYCQACREAKKKYQEGQL